MQYPAVENRFSLFRPLNEKKFSDIAKSDKLQLDSNPGNRYYALFLQKCPCGYSVPDITKKTNEIEEIVKSAAYKKEKWDYPGTEGYEFLRYSQILECLKDYTGAGWSCIYAAWIYDLDLLLPMYQELAIKCRKRATEMFKKARGQRRKFCIFPGR